MIPIVFASGWSFLISSSCGSTGSLSETPVMLPVVRPASPGSVMALNTTGMFLSSAAAYQAVAEGVAMAHISATFLEEKLLAICVAVALSNEAF